MCAASRLAVAAGSKQEVVPLGQSWLEQARELQQRGEKKKKRSLVLLFVSNCVLKASSLTSGKCC